ncbi:molybdenum transport protein [Methanococcus maripaludis]|uniref:Nicotinate-nucleotide pyrophosphorylase [carboxylating] n=1 Tax=Methanococcus maripaludis TaxID=39152 RepID=A0A7J9P5W3_METMI|nr:ModD protein [Methanococcus maripaludis]MBA2858585.1 molybdenum transport protein [Methanococcus maripaludis]
MSFYIPDYELEKIIEEDINPLDLTSQIMKLDRFNAKLAYKARHDMVLCCTEEAERICKILGLEVISYKRTGSYVKEGEVFFEAKGRADNVHLAWKSVLRLLEGYCGMATRTYEFVTLARKYNENINVVTTRKNLAGTKKPTIKAIVAGGAYPHRLGLSETILIFDEHLAFVNDDEELKYVLKEMKANALEKKIGIEVDNFETGIKYVKMGFDYIQLDKVDSKTVEKFVKAAKEINPNITIVAAGGITIQNIAEYAKTGAEVIVTSALYFGKAADIRTIIEKID